MRSKSTVEIADRYSRKRAFGIAVAAVVFLVIQVLVRPFLSGPPDPGHQTRIDWWAVNALALLLLLATGGGLLNRRQIRALVNDEISRLHYKMAVVAGYWVAMAAAMGLYAVPRFQDITARQAIFVMVTSSIVVALLTFAYLEHRALREG